jgi:hypothetical protein
MSVLLQSGDWVGAEGTAREALGLAPGNADAQRGLALALFRQDRNREAADVLRSMLAVRDDGAARELLARILKTGSDESGMTEQRLAHFHVRYDGDAHDAVGREILSALERHYAALTIAMDHQPGVTIPVILFSRQNYYDANGMPFWAGGHYDETDGRVRIPIGDLTPSLTPGLDGVLIHELTHAFIADMTKATAPREIHEGLAQYMEGKRLDTLLERDQLSALARGRIGGVGGFYLSALGFVEHLMASRGQGGMNELLRAMGETRNVDEAFRRVYDRNFQAAYAEWRERFQRTEGG